MTIEEIEERWNYAFDRACNLYDDAELYSFIGDHMRDLIAVAKAARKAWRYTKCRGSGAESGDCPGCNLKRAIERLEG